MKWFLPSFCAVALAGCDALPRDASGTLERIRTEHSVRVGLIEGGAPPGGDAAAGAFLDRVARATGARPVVRRGSAEPLLIDLEQGRLDLVLGTLSEDTPWAGHVAILPPLATTAGQDRLHLTPIARNGENRWIMLLEREADAVAPGGAG